MIVDIKAKYCTARFRVLVYIRDGLNVFTIPAEEVRVEYPLWDIPTCRIKAIVGMEMSTRFISWAQHLREDFFQLGLTVELQILGISGRFNPNNYFLGTRVIFDGYVTRIEYSRDITSIAVTIFGIHWLYNLAFSSALSDRLHPHAPADITFNPFFVSGAGSLGALLSVDFFAKLLPPPLVILDLGSAVKWLLTFIANIDRFLLQYFPGSLRINDTFHRYAGLALSRLVSGDPRLVLYNEFNPIDKFLWYSIYTILIHHSIEHGPLTLTALAETTIWERLIKVLGPLFLFTIVPYPEFARIVPYMPTYFDTWRFIQPTEILSVYYNTVLSRPLMATVLLTQNNTPNETDQGLNLDSLSRTLVGGAYIGFPDGMMSFKYAPPYANFMLAIPGLAAMQSLARVIVSSKRGYNFAFPTVTNPSTIDWAKQEYLQINVLGRLAHFYYTLELLKDRRLVIVGPPRFDISPASIVTVTSLNEKFIGNIGPNTMVTGYVNNVAHVFRSSPHHALASTILELGFVRFGLQNFHNNCTIPYHPLYDSFFKGSTFFGDTFVSPETFPY